MAEWLRNISDDDLKALDSEYPIGIDGVHYTYDVYDELYNLSVKVKVGDILRNPYTKELEPIKEIRTLWSDVISKGETVGEFLEINFITEKGYIIYDLFDCERCEHW